MNHKCIIVNVTSSLIILTSSILTYNLVGDVNFKVFTIVGVCISFLVQVILNEVLIEYLKWRDDKESEKIQDELSYEIDTLRSNVTELNTELRYQLKINSELQTSVFHLREKVRVDLLAKNKIELLNMTDRELLGVSELANRKQIKENYLKLSNIYHPDKCGSDTMFKRLSKAYQRTK